MWDISAPLTMNYNQPDIRNGPLFPGNTNILSADVQAAMDAGAVGATIYYGHGSGVRERLGLLGFAVDIEKEIIGLVVGDDQLDRVFERIYFAAKLNLPGAGIIYVTKLDKAATFVPK